MNDRGRPFPEPIPRYTANERTNHWLVALSFIAAALSGLALFHPWGFWLTALFGGGQWTRILHPFFGVFMFIVFFLLAFRMWGDNTMDARDREWVRSMRQVVNNREEGVPEVGRFNGGQKLLFWSLIVCMIALLVTGLIMWRPYLAAAFPIGLVRFASLLHAFFALVIICLIIVHIYSGFWVKGAMAAMTRGWVTRGWAHKHHRAWLRDIDNENAPR